MNNPLQPSEEQEQKVLPEFVPSAGLWVSSDGDSLPVVGFIRVYEEMDPSSGFYRYMPVTPIGVVAEENYFDSREAADESGIR